MKRIALLAVGLSLIPFAAAEQAAKPSAAPKAAAPNEWSLRVYRFPAMDLTDGFVSPESGQLRVPAMPKADAKEEEIATFLRHGTDVLIDYLKIQGVQVPKGTLFAYDPENWTLAARTTGEVHEQLAMLSTFYLGRVPEFLNVSLQLMEADGAVMRDMVNDAVANANHAPLLARLEGLADKGQARRIASYRIPTKSGQRAAVGRMEHMSHASGLSADKHNWLDIPMESREVGTRLEVDPVIGPDGRTIDLNFSLDHHFSPATERWEPAFLNGSRQVETRVTDYHVAGLTTAITVISGTTTLLEVWKPEPVTEPERANAWQAAFARVDAPQLIPQVSNRAEELLKEHGEKVEPQPKPSAGPARPLNNLPPGMMLRRFRVPPDFLSSVADPDRRRAGAAPGPDPFAAPPGASPKNEPRVSVRMTAVEILKAAGIEFPPGSSANFNAYTSEVLVRNKPENLDAIANLVDELRQKAPMCLGVRLNIVQADAAVIRRLSEETAGSSDHTAALRSLQESAQAGKAKILRTLWLETRSGQRASTWFGQEQMHVSAPEIRNTLGTASPPNPEAKKAANDSNKTKEPPSTPSTPAVHAVQSVDHSVERIGTQLEIDPVLGPDGRTIDLNFALNYDYALPAPRPKPAGGDDKSVRALTPANGSHKANVTTAVTLLSGLPQLVGIWQPEGAAEFQSGDVLQAAFISVDVMRIGVEDHR